MLALVTINNVKLVITESSKVSPQGKSLV